MKNMIKNIALTNGADVCGVAGIERFADARNGFSPTDVWSECRSVIVVGIALPKGLSLVNSRLIYGHFNHISSPAVDMVSFITAKEIENKFGGSAVPLPCNSPYEYWDKEKSEGRGLISMKHAAVAAGIGTLGKNTLLMNSEYGNMLTIGAILTDLKLPSDPLAKSICIEGCSLCIKSCPVQAIDNGSVIQKKCRENTYGSTDRGFDTVECNKCRTVCPMRLGKK